jgi:hypothetical protein
MQSKKNETEENLIIDILGQIFGNVNIKQKKSKIDD